MLPFAWFNYIQTEFKVNFWNKPPITHTYNFITTMQCQVQRISWPAEAIEYGPTDALVRDVSTGSLCCSTKLEKLTFKYCKFVSSSMPWLKVCLKMHFLQVEWKSSSRSGADP